MLKPSTGPRRNTGVSIDSLFRIVKSNRLLWTCLERLPALELPDWYLGAGCVAQTVWNACHGYQADYGIVDYDVVYFDRDLSEEKEASIAAKIGDLTEDLGIKVDVKNQARVHLWYERKFGYGIRPYSSSADAIATWPTTATAVGLRLVGDSLHVHAPFDIIDLSTLVVRANRAQITPAIYNAKVVRWSARWPKLTVCPWDEGVGCEGARRTRPV